MNKIDTNTPKEAPKLNQENVRLDDPIEGAEINLNQHTFTVNVDCLGEITEECKKSYRED